MPLRKEPPTPRSAAVAARLDGAQQAGTSSATALGPLIPVRPGETSLRRQAILTEDEYTSALSAVIKRDFFPDLDRMTAENEYLAAVEADDPRRIRTALERLLSFDGQQRRPASTARTTRSSGRQTSATGARATRGEWDDTPVASASTSKVFDPTLTPAISTPGLDAPLEEQGSDEAEPSSGIVPDVSLSLADFQARYTSEDNASFAQLLERGNEERKRKHAWLYARERASVEQRRRIQSVERQEAEAGRRLAIEANPDHPKLIAEAKTTLLLEGKGGSKATEPESAPSPEPRPKQRRIRWTISSSYRNHGETTAARRRDWVGGSTPRAMRSSSGRTPTPIICAHPAQKPLPTTKPRRTLLRSGGWMGAEERAASRRRVRVRPGGRRAVRVWMRRLRAGVLARSRRLSTRTTRPESTGTDS